MSVLWKKTVEKRWGGKTCVISWIDRLVIISKCFQRKRAFASFIRQSKWNNRKWAFHTVFLTRFLKNKKETTKGIVQANRQSNNQVSFFFAIHPFSVDLIFSILYQDGANREKERKRLYDDDDDENLV